jgi:hypothetical protein
MLELAQRGRCVRSFQTCLLFGGLCTTALLAFGKPVEPPTKGKSGKTEPAPPPTLRVARDEPPLIRIGEQSNEEATEPTAADASASGGGAGGAETTDDADPTTEFELDPAQLPDGPADEDGWAPRGAVQRSDPHAQKRLPAQPIGHSSRRRNLPIKRPRDPILDRDATGPELEPPIVDETDPDAPPAEASSDPAKSRPIVDDEGFSDVYDGRSPANANRRPPNTRNQPPAQPTRDRGETPPSAAGKKPLNPAPSSAPHTPPANRAAAGRKGIAAGAPVPAQSPSGAMNPKPPQTKPLTPPLASPNSAAPKSAPEGASRSFVVPSIAPFDMALPRLVTPLAPNVQRLRAPIRSALAYHQARRENVAERTPWGVFHAILPYRDQTQLIAGRKIVNAISWLAGNQPMRGLRLLTKDAQGLTARQGIGLQGHQGQMLAIFAQTGVPAEYPLYIGRERFTVQDLIDREMADCRPATELTFVLIGLAGYLPTDSHWESSDGESWDFERLLREELSQPIVGAACGGTHRLMGYTFALRQRRAEGLPITGQWERADEYVQDFIKYALSLQNPDGSMSTSWFEGRADNGKLERKLQTSGHIMEWLIYALPPERLTEDRVVRGVSFLTRCLWDQRERDWEVGPKGHALRALALYQHRVLGNADAVPANAANSGQPTTTVRTTAKPQSIRRAR